MKKFVDLDNRAALIIYHHNYDFGENESKFNRFKTLFFWDKLNEEERKEWEEMKLITGKIKPHIETIEILSTCADINPKNNQLSGYDWYRINGALSELEKECGDLKQISFYEAVCE